MFWFWNLNTKLKKINLCKKGIFSWQKIVNSLIVFNFLYFDKWQAFQKQSNEKNQKCWLILFNALDRLIKRRWKMNWKLTDWKRTDQNNFVGSESVGAVVAAQSDVAKLRRFYKIWNARTQIGFESVPTEKIIFIEKII